MPSFDLEWGSGGSGDGELSFPLEVEVDSSGNVYVTDNGNNRVEKFAADGTFVTTWGTTGSGDGELSFPLEVEVDSSGNVYVTDNGNNRVEKFASDGTFLTKWGTFGSDDGQFDFPVGIAADDSGNVYVTDRNNHRIQKFGAPPQVNESVDARLTIRNDHPTTDQRVLLELDNNGSPILRFTDSSNNTSWDLRQTADGGFAATLSGTGGTEFQIGPGGELKVGPGPNTVFEVSPTGDTTISGNLTILGNCTGCLPGCRRPGGCRDSLPGSADLSAQLANLTAENRALQAEVRDLQLRLGNLEALIAALAE